MKQQYTTMLFLALSAAILQAEPVAWIRLGDPDGQRYMNTPYHWLGDEALLLTVDVQPAAGYALDLLWGAKKDQRGAIVLINGESQTVKA